MLPICPISLDPNLTQEQRIFLLGGCVRECRIIINPHQRCGYSDSPFARVHYFYTARSRNEFEGVGAVCTRKLYPRKRYFFLIEKYIEDARQDEKHVPDLLESIMRPTDPVKEELRRNLFRMSPFGSKIHKIRVSTVWIPEIQSFPVGGQCQPSRQEVLRPSNPE